MIEAVQLSPPYVTIERQIELAIGADANSVKVEVASDKKQEAVHVIVQSSYKGKALTTLLRKKYENVGKPLSVTVTNRYGEIFDPFNPVTADEVKLVFAYAFQGNPLYTTTYTRISPIGFTFVYPVFRRAIIQFPNDDTADYFFNYNGVAARVFEEIIDFKVDGIVLGFTTAPS